MTNRHTLMMGALLAAAGVALGAFGAHGLEGRLIALGYETELAKRLDWFETGVKYQLYHAVGLIVVAILARQSPELQTLRKVAVLFVVGTVLFSGSLFAMTLLSADWRFLGAIVPLGGVSFIAGWLLIFYGALRNKAEN